MNKLFFFIPLFIFTSITVAGQLQEPAVQLEQLVNNETSLTTLGVRYPALVQTFYKSHAYKPAWVTAANSANRHVLLQDIAGAGNLGLRARDYHYAILQGVAAKTTIDSATTDVLLTDAAIHFYGDVQTGNTMPHFRYDGLNYKPDRSRVIEQLTASLKTGRLPQLISELEPVSDVYRNIKLRVAHLNAIRASQNFEEVIIRSINANYSNNELIVKLYQLGVLDSLQPTSIPVLVKKIKEAQKLFGVLNDGVIRSLTLEVLNVPLQQRANELETALNYIRWANAIQHQNPVILVNIPSANLWVYDGKRLLLDSRIIVGKPATPTPTLSSTVNEVILYPYWMVPQNIATKELLPRIKKNRDYLEQNNFQVLNKQGAIVNPRSVNWVSLNSDNFPYIIRQSTGCDNSLGLVKLNFYNPFTVYLHDTPGKTLFSLNKRYFSHGCMRVEKALDLAYLLAQNHTTEMNAIIEKGCLKNKTPVTIAASQPMDVFVIYSTVWYDTEGKFSFYDDIYHRLDTAGNVNDQLFQNPIVAQDVK